MGWAFVVALFLAILGAIVLSIAERFQRCLGCRTRALRKLDVTALTGEPLPDHVDDEHEPTEVARHYRCAACGLAQSRSGKQAMMTTAAWQAQAAQARALLVAFEQAVRDEFSPEPSAKLPRAINLPSPRSTPPGSDPT